MNTIYVFLILGFLLQGILIWSLLTFQPTDFGGVSYPSWGDALGWCSVMFGVIFIPIMAIVAVIRAKGNIFKVIFVPLKLSLAMLNLIKEKSSDVAKWGKRTGTLPFLHLAKANLEHA